MIWAINWSPPQRLQNTSQASKSHMARGEGESATFSEDTNFPLMKTGAQGDCNRSPQSSPAVNIHFYHILSQTPRRPPPPTFAQGLTAKETRKLSNESCEIPHLWLNHNNFITSSKTAMSRQQTESKISKSLIDITPSFIRRLPSGCRPESTTNVFVN